MKRFDDEIEELAYAVIGAAIEVHRVLGPGLLESVYERALLKELVLCNIPVERQVRVSVEYKGDNIGDGLIDLLVGGRLVVELKAVEAIHPIHEAQTVSYLKILGEPLGLLLNFNVRTLKEGGIHRIIFDR